MSVTKFAAAINSHGRTVNSWRLKKRMFRLYYWENFKKILKIKDPILDKAIRDYEEHLKDLFDSKYADIDRLIKHILNKKGMDYPYYGHSREDTEQEAKAWAWKRFDDYDSLDLNLGTYLGYIIGMTLTRFRLKAEVRNSKYLQKEWDEKMHEEYKKCKNEMDRKRKSRRPVTNASSLDAPLVVHNDNYSLHDAVQHVDDEDMEHKVHLKIMLNDARQFVLDNKILNERELHIVIGRFYQNRTLEDVGESFKKLEGKAICRERVRQIQERSLKKLRRAVRKHDVLRHINEMV